uniref:Uncharacterized protein n=1 Tax=uncultured marine microorganism HF4000_APKG1C9 TaxID=455540 RepID=B3T6A4_9ZZZZ|nr:hypothetical protein ALOHA_HF4000APKG1C9ctg2g16 [uncultured marine microorganism HF4000_APKG1C9]
MHHRDQESARREFSCSRPARVSERSSVENGSERESAIRQQSIDTSCRIHPCQMPPNYLRLQVNWGRFARLLEKHSHSLRL